MKKYYINIIIDCISILIAIFNLYFYWNKSKIIILIMGICLGATFYWSSTEDIINYYKQRKKVKNAKDKKNR